MHTTDLRDAGMGLDDMLANYVECRKQHSQHSLAKGHDADVMVEGECEAGAQRQHQICPLKKSAVMR